jgi:4a-hydroxytetrahydrobiopterin dehydratase
MERRILNEAELTDAVKTLDGWYVSGTLVKKRIKFPDFAASLGYVNRVGALAESADHHPDITFGWGYAEIALTTHDRGGVTDVDIALARQIDALEGG